MKKEEKEEKEQQVEQQVEQKIQQVSNQELVFKKPQGRPQYSNNTTMKQQQDEKILQSETSPQCTDQRILELGMKVYSTNTPIIKTTRINALNMDTYTINPESQIMFSMFRNKQYPVIESKDFSGVAIKPRLPISSQGQIPEFKFQEINMEEIIDNLNECFLIKQQLSEGSKQTLYEYLYQKKQVVYNRLNIFQKLSEKKYYFTVVHNPNTKNDYDTLYQFFNQIFMEVFQIHFKDKLGNQTPFNEVLFNNLVDKLVVQQPYGRLDLTRDQLQNHMLNPTNVQNAKRFIDTYGGQQFKTFCNCYYRLQQKLNRFR